MGKASAVKPKRPLAAALAPKGTVLKAAGITGRPPAKRSPKGRLLPLASLLSPKFKKRLEQHLADAHANLAAFGLTTAAQFRLTLIKAHKRLGKTKVTATDWLGRVFEIIGPGLPDVKRIEQLLVNEIRGLINGGGLIFINGLRKIVEVKKRFNSHRVIYNVRIKLAGQAVGEEFVDRANLLGNGDGQELLMSLECKTRGAAGDLPRQLAERNKRLREAIRTPGAVLTYNVEGKTGLFETRVEDLVFIKGQGDLFTKIGLRAGKKFRSYIARDAAGGLYVRIVVPCSTDSIRQILERMLRDPSWQ